MKKYSILTYNIGGYEVLHEVENPSENCEYVYVTDDKSITSSTWNVVYVENEHPEDNMDLCYTIRFNPFDYVSTDVVIRIDGTTTPCGDTDEIYETFIKGGYDIGLFIHPERYNFAEELSVWEKYRNYKHGQTEKTLGFIRDSGYDVDGYLGIFQGNVMIHKNTETNREICDKTLSLMRQLAYESRIDRLDQVIFSFVVNSEYNQLKVLPLGDNILDGSYFKMFWHGTYVRIPVTITKNKKYMFNKEVEPYKFKKCRTMDKKKCVIIVPAYKPQVSEDERQSLIRLRSVLGKYDIRLVCPEGMDVQEYSFPLGETWITERFDAKHFADRMAYGKLLNSVEFYERFSDYEYMLVYQTDCWVFRDELDMWCDKGYDYIGAPFFVKWFSDRGLFVGNGGFSLRKIDSIITYLKKFLGKGLPHEGTDDGFFAANFDKSLNIPTPQEASLFSLEVSPSIQYRQNGNKLPFGCHAYKRYDWGFWKQFIDYDAFDNLKTEVTFAILNYGNDENAALWYRRFKDYFDTYIIDTKCLDNGLDNPFGEFGDDPHILLEHNVYNGGQRIITYNKMVEDGTKWMMTVDSDVEMRDEKYVTALINSVQKVVQSNDIGVYEPSAEPGSKCMGQTGFIAENLHQFKQGSNGFRAVEGGEGWFRLVRKDIADRIYPFQNFEDNKYGWGGEAHYYLAKQMGLKTVIDDTVTLFHPQGMSYPNTEAVEERKRFMQRFPELGIEEPKYKTAEEIKTLICCIGKNENRYVRHYVEWYRNLGITHIRLYDNNDPDGERFEDVIGDYINDGFVEIVDVRGQKVIQLKCYTDCYAEMKNDYDWILFIDCGDEYLTFTRQMTVGQYLAMPQFRNYDMIHVNLMTFGDCGKTDVTDEPLWVRFPDPIPADRCIAYNFPEDMHVSSIIRGGLDNIKWEGKGFTHTPSPNNLRCCNNVGFYVDSESPFAPVDFQIAAFRHYTTKMAREYCEKMRRGFPDQLWDGSRVKNLIETRFFRTNEVTKEKVQIFKDELGIDVSYLLPKEEAIVSKRDDIKVYSLCYTRKNFDFINTDCITPLQVGAANGTDVCRTKDNTGDNISDKNYLYIENTGTYWIWKNVHDVKIKGQMQYRRPFSGITELDIEKTLEKYDVITCEPFYHPDHKTPTEKEPMVIPADTVEQGYAFSNCVDDLYVLEMAIKAFYPDYAEDYDKYIKNGPNLYYSNGFIMKAEDYDRYCEFLFKCLDGYLTMTGIHSQKELEEHVKYNLEVGKYPRYEGNRNIPERAFKWQCSILGFLSERVWTLWLQHNFKDEKILKIPYEKQEEGMYT